MVGREETAGRLVAKKMWIRDVLRLFSGGSFSPRVRLLGTVVGFEKKTGHVEAALDDHSGVLPLRLYPGVDDKIRPGDLLDVVGRVKNTPEGFFVRVEKLFRVSDPNEECCRLLENEFFGKKGA